MAVALAPDAFLVHSPAAWDVYFSACCWRRIDTDRQAFTVLAYLGNVFVSGGFQFTADANRKLIVYRCTDFADLLAGTGPTLAVGDWWFFGLTTIGPDVPNNVVVYYARKGDPSLTAATVSYSGQYQYTRHGVGWRPGVDGEAGVFYLAGSAAHDRTWQNTTLTPAEMLAEYQSPTVVRTAGLWSAWPMATAATATVDASGNSRPLVAVAGAGSITDTDDPFSGQSASIGAVTSATAAQPLGRAKRRALGPVAVASTAGPLTATKRRPLIPATSGTLAEPTGEAKARLLVAAAAPTAAAPIDGAKAQDLPPAISPATALSLAQGKRRSLGAAAIATIAASVGAAKRLVLGPANASTSAETLGKTKRHRLLPATTSTVVGSLGAGEPIGVATQRSVVGALGARKRSAVGSVTCAVVPQALGRRKARTLAAATSATTAQALVAEEPGRLTFITRVRPVVEMEVTAYD